ncbi:MAG: mechanosensitive ion channel family protein [Acidimicrobiia bacterium]
MLPVFQTFSFQTPELSPCGDPPGLLCDWIYDLTGNDSAARFADWLLAKPAKLLLILVVALIANRLIRRGIRRMVERLIVQREERARARQDSEIEDGRFASLRARAIEKTQMLRVQEERGKQRALALGAVLRSVASLTIYTLAGIIILAEFGVSLGPLVAGAGIVGIALGFGAQSLVKDFLNGIFMLVEDQYGVGDIIDVGDAVGVVEEVNLRTTRLRDVNGTVWFVPNGEIRRIGNKSQQWARTVLDVEVAYNTDLAKAVDVIREVVNGVWQDHLEQATVLEEPEILGVESFGESAIVIRVVLKVEPGEQFATAREVRKRLKFAFDREGIEIPFPQRTIWMKQEEEPPRKPAPAREPDLESSGDAAEE